MVTETQNPETITFEQIFTQYPDRVFESGYLLIETDYQPSSPEQGEREAIEANANIAKAVRKIIQGHDSCVKGAVVQETVDGQTRYYVIVSLSLPTDTDHWGDNPLQRAAEKIMEVLGQDIEVNSNIKVDRVTPAKKVTPELPTGLQGPP